MKTGTSEEELGVLKALPCDSDLEVLQIIYHVCKEVSSTGHSHPDSKRPRAQSQQGNPGEMWLFEHHPRMGPTSSFLCPHWWVEPGAIKALFETEFLF